MALTAASSAPSKTPWGFEMDARSGMGACLKGHSGQASVEAAILLPAAMLLLAFLIQPACLLYTRSVMESTAIEVSRLKATSGVATDVRAFALRRLAAVPEVSVFHVGGEQDWQVVADESDGGTVSVEVVGHARPLPLFGGIAAALGESDEMGLVLRTSAQVKVRPDWLEGGYDDWVGAWG